MRLLPIFALLACGTSDSGTSTEATSTGSTGGATAEPTTGEHHHDSSTGADTHDEHGSSEHGGSEHGGSEHGEQDTAHETTGGGTPVEQYCACMLVNCHDQYHALWGEDHMQSEAMCAAAAEAVPSAGAPAMSGDSIECRIHFCGLGHDDPTACDAALGAAPCAD